MCPFSLLLGVYKGTQTKRKKGKRVVLGNLGDYLRAAFGNASPSKSGQPPKPPKPSTLNPKL